MRPASRSFFSLAATASLVITLACGDRQVLGSLRDGAAPEPDDASTDASRDAAGDAGGYDPCAGKSCGAACAPCAPGDPSCVGISVFQQCNRSGKCSPDPPACGTDVYAPCAGKRCGDDCTLCAPGDPSCVEPGVVKYCQRLGECTPGQPVCITGGD